LAQEAVIRECGTAWVQFQAKKPLLAKAILAGNYDSDIAINSRVSLFLSYNNTSAPFTVMQKAFAGDPSPSFYSSPRGYFSIFFFSSGIALFGSLDCLQTMLDKAPAFMKDLQGTFQLLLY
jgi:hypothetical protein